MGLLAESKSRRKLNTDPNNTKWTRDTNTFGQKILRSQGWQPGEFLGAKDAPHSELHTSANASYIRVTLKDDMKGLGFDRRKEDETPGLGEFSDLLSRLNGKSEAAVEKDRQARMVFKTHAYVQAKYGAMRFVRGGLLVGDELKEENDDTTSAETTEAETKKDKKSKKRKAASLDEEDQSSAKDSEAKSKKQRKEERKNKKRSAEASSAEPDDTAKDEPPKAKKEKKSKSKKDKSRSESEAEAKATSNTEDEKPKAKVPESVEDSDEDETAKSKKSKKERKEEKREKKERKKKEKEEKKRKKREAEALAESASSISSALPSADTTSQSTPAGSGTSTPRGNPHRVRSRFLAAKREAMIDDKALNKIWMVKV